MSQQPRATAQSSARVLAIGTAISLALAGIPVAAVGVPQPTLPEAATVDILPAPQINGVVWDQAVSGDTVFAVGHFDSVRPHGAPLGVGEQARHHALAYSLTSGDVMPFAPQFNGQVRTVATSNDGSIVFFGGDFTSVGDQPRYRAAAFDAHTGELLDWFAPSFDYVILTIEVTDTTVYFGGKFSMAGRTPRSNVAAYSLRSGRLTTWNPEITGGQVMSIAAHPTKDVVALAGNFTEINGQAEPGWGAVTASDGANLPWDGNQHLTNSGTNAAMYSLAADDEQVYVTGYQFYGDVPFENVAAASWDGGRLNWVSGCEGDTYDVALAGDVLYTVGHTHDCATIGGVPEFEGQPRRYQRASAYTAAPSPLGRKNELGSFEGWVAPEILAFNPDFNIGTYTGQNQGTWTIETAGDYVLVGGEFTEVDGTQQQGLARFAKRGVAPAMNGPRGDLQVKPKSVDQATVTVSFATVSDRDDALLEYELHRDGKPVATHEARSFWWTVEESELVDRDVPKGVHEYTVVARDRDGNELVSPAVSIDVADGMVLDDPDTPTDPDRAAAYSALVSGDGPVAYWGLGEAAGNFASTVGRRDLQVDPRADRNVRDAFGGDTAVNFGATDGFGAAETRKSWGLQTFTVEALIKTDSDTGGVIANFGDSKSGHSWGKDRFVSMTDTGQLQLGVFSDRARVLRTDESFNDGQWHHVAATVDSRGARLVVDGVQRVSDDRMKGALRFWGYWRVGNEGMGTWRGAPSSAAFDGTIDELAIYSRALPTPQLAAHAVAAGLAAPEAATGDVAEDGAAGDGVDDLGGTQAALNGAFGAADAQAGADGRVAGGDRRLAGAQVLGNGQAAGGAGAQGLDPVGNADDGRQRAAARRGVEHPRPAGEPHPQLAQTAVDPLNIQPVLDDPAVTGAPQAGGQAASKKTAQVTDRPHPSGSPSPSPNPSPSPGGSPSPATRPVGGTSGAAVPGVGHRGTVAVSDSLRAGDGDPTHRWAAKEHSTLVISGDQGLVIAAPGSGSAMVLGRDIQVQDAAVAVTLPDGLQGIPVGAGVGVALGADKTGSYRAVVRPRAGGVTELAIEHLAGDTVTVLKRTRAAVPADGPLDMVFESAGDGTVLRALVSPHGEQQMQWDVETQAPGGAAAPAGSAGFVVDASSVAGTAQTHATFCDVVLTVR